MAYRVNDGRETRRPGEEVWIPETVWTMGMKRRIYLRRPQMTHKGVLSLKEMEILSKYPCPSGPHLRNSWEPFSVPRVKPGFLMIFSKKKML